MASHVHKTKHGVSGKFKGRRNTRYTEAKDHVKFMKNIAHELELRIKEEHEKGPPDKALLLKTIDAQQQQLNLIKAKIDAAKQQSKKRKQEIDYWKNWYARIPDIDKLEEWEKVKNEATWRGAEITSLEQRISELETEKLGVIIEFEMAQDQLAALEAGAYDVPVERDPRVLAVRKEFEEAKIHEKKAKSSAEKSEISNEGKSTTKKTKHGKQKEKEKGTSNID